MVSLSDSEAVVRLDSSVMNCDLTCCSYGREERAKVRALVHKNLLRETSIDGHPTLEEDTPHSFRLDIRQASCCTESGSFINDVEVAF